MLPPGSLALDVQAAVGAFCGLGHRLPNNGSSRSVRAGSMSRRSSTGISGHQRLLAVKRPRRSMSFQLKHLAQRHAADQIDDSMKVPIRSAARRVIERGLALLLVR